MVVPGAILAGPPKETDRNGSALSFLALSLRERDSRQPFGCLLG
jgi:hypothetical protein